MSRTKTTQPPQEGDTEGPFRDLDLSGVDSEPRTPSKKGSTDVSKIDLEPEQTPESLLLFGMSLQDYVDSQNDPFDDVDLAEFVSHYNQRNDRISGIRTDVNENTQKITAISKNLEQISSINNRLDQIEKNLDSTVGSEQMGSIVQAETSKQINERIVAPLLFGTAFILLVAMLGSLLTGAWLISAVILPVPVLTGYYLWKSRNV
jgi:tetrahydromethanopterin S-methyltransferase subunit G